MKKQPTNTPDYLQYYNLEDYLFSNVTSRYQEQGYIDAFDLFCIVIWKANRAKSKIAQRLLKKGHKDLEQASIELTSQIHQAFPDKEKLRVLIKDWGFLLPMASAILTVMYPQNFTIYDIRVCDELNGFHNLKNITNFDKLWDQYQKFQNNIEKIKPIRHLDLRGKDRYLWGKSFHNQLKKDIENKFTEGSS